MVNKRMLNMKKPFIKKKKLLNINDPYVIANASQKERKRHNNARKYYSQFLYNGIYWTFDDMSKAIPPEEIEKIRKERPI